MAVNIIVLLLTTINVGFAYIVFNYSQNIDIENIYVYFGLFYIIQAIVILYSIRIFYEIPILKLKLAIQKFLLGKSKDVKIKVDNSQNENLNYIITFFLNTINSLKSIKQEFIHGKEIKSEVEIGKEIQGKSLNKKLVEVPSLNVVAKTRQAGEIGGDSYDIIKTNDNYYIYVGDATGHGVGAGFIMIMVNSLIDAFSRVYEKGSNILSSTNKILKPKVKANLLMSVLLLRWNEKEKRMFMSGAGHEYLLIYKQKTKKCYKIRSGGIALGMIKDSTKLIKEKEVSFEAGDIIVLYSDGITEAINKPKKDGSEQMFGEDRLMDAIEKAPSIKGKNYKTANSVFNNITISLSKFMGYKHTQRDDITLAAVQYKPSDYQAIEDFDLEIKKEYITEWNWIKE